jgi:hypothetical protein
LKDAEAHLAAAETKCTKDVAFVEAKAAKAMKVLAVANQRQSKCEQAFVEHVEAMSISFGSRFHPSLDFCLSYFINFCAN